MTVSMSPAGSVPPHAGIGIEMVPRQCKLKPYKPVEIEKLAIAGEFILYASPDSTYARTRQLLDDAKTSILIGIYDFTADYMRDILTSALDRGVAVSIMVDLDNRKGEPELWEQMIEDGITGIPAPSCASKKSRYFSSCHEKVIVIDNEWTLIQSGNYTDNSIPKNEIDGCDPADGCRHAAGQLCAQREPRSVGSLPGDAVGDDPGGDDRAAVSDLQDGCRGCDLRVPVGW